MKSMRKLAIIMNVDDSRHSEQVDNQCNLHYITSIELFTEVFSVRVFTI